VKALLVFGEDPDADLSELEFLMVSDTHMTETAEKADVILPGTGFASADGTFTNTERRLQAVNQAVNEEISFNNWELAAELAHVFEVEMPFDDEVDISREMDDLLLSYRYAQIGEVLGGALSCEDPTLVPVEKAAFVEEMKNSDNLMNMMDERLPKPVK